MPDRGAAGEDVRLGPIRIGRQKMSYVSLHHHSTYSFLDGYGHPKEHVYRAAELGMSALALTEHGNISSHPKLEQAAQEIGIKPIYGSELYCGPSKPTQRKNHLTVLASTQDGYRNLLRMLTWAWQEGFYYQPTVQGEAFSQYHEGLIVASGCRGSLLATSLVGGKNIEPEEASYERGLRVARRFKDLLGDRYYLETQAFPDLPDTVRINQMLEQIGKRLKIPLVATADVHYCKQEDNRMQIILHAVRPGQNRSFEEEERSWGYDVPLCHPTSDKYVRDRLTQTGLSRRAVNEAIANTKEIADRCNVELPKAAPLAFPLTDGETTPSLWKRWLREGWIYRGISRKRNRDEYAARLEYEVSIIEQKEYVDYFLIVSDMVKHAKDTGIFVGPARGSAAASLVCYLLRITEIDPMMFPDLVFERFIDITRKDLPDIDLDFDDERRHEVFEYLAERFGPDRVGQLGTFVTYKSKNSLIDVARVHGVPTWEVEKVKNLLLERSSGDLRASATIEDTVAMFPEAKQVFEDYPDMRAAQRLEGMVKGMGRHAAGAIVASTPLTETCAVYGDTISMDKYDAEHLNLLKVDVLGLSTCGMLATAMEMLGKDIEFLYGLPLDDEETMRGFQENDVVAIFQFDGRAMRLVNNALKPDNFYEVTLVNLLARPGPLHNNATMHYVDIKHGKIQPEQLHPIFDRIVENSRYQVISQEQILRIVREVGQFDWTHAAYIRKIISRKIGEQEFNRQWKRFWKGAKANGLDRKTAKQIWGMCITAGSYAFNFAHAVSYSMLGYWTMWLKRHHPLIFYAAALQRLPEPKHLEIMRDASRHGLKVLPPDPALSDVTWTPVGDDTLVAGFSQIPGIGMKMGQVIVDHRREHGMKEWEDMLDVKGVGPKTLMKILEWVDSEDPLGVHVLDRKLKQVVKSIEHGRLRGNGGRKLPMPTHTVATVPYGRGQDTQVVWIGVIVHRNLRDLFEVNFSRTGVPLDPKGVRDSDLREWVLLHGTDGDDILTITVDRWKYPKFKEVVWSLKLGHDIVLIKGVKKGFLPHKQVYVSEMTVIG